MSTVSICSLQTTVSNGQYYLTKHSSKCWSKRRRKRRGKSNTDERDSGILIMSDYTWQSITGCSAFTNLEDLSELHRANKGTTTSHRRGNSPSHLLFSCPRYLWSGDRRPIHRSIKSAPALSLETSIISFETRWTDELILESSRQTSSLNHDNQSHQRLHCLSIGVRGITYLYRGHIIVGDSIAPWFIIV